MNHLGPRAFDEIGGEVVQTTSFIYRKTDISEYKGVYCRLVDKIGEKLKREGFLSGEDRFIATKTKYKQLPGNPIGYWISNNVINVYKKGIALGSIAAPRKGNSTSDNNRFLRYWAEVDRNKMNIGSEEIVVADSIKRRWYPYNKGGGYRKWYGFNEYLIDWYNDASEIRAIKTAVIANYQYFMKPGLTWSTVSSNNFSIRKFGKGYIFDNGGCCIFELGDKTNYLLGLLNSSVFKYIFGQLNPTLNFQSGEVAKFPVIFLKLDEINLLVDENVKIATSEYDSYETSWNFKKHPLLVDMNIKKTNNSILIKEAYANWEQISNSRFTKMRANEMNLNHIFIKIYGLESEVSPDVNDNLISLRIANKETDIKSLISYAVGCMFGRYSLNREGLIYAGGNIDELYWKCQGRSPLDKNGLPLDGYAGVSLEEYNYGYFRDNEDWRKATALKFNVDYDNVIPITDEDYFSDDIVGRFVEFIKTVYGDDTLEENLDFIANVLGNKGDTSREVIRNYFLKDFYADHLKVYQKRPIYWLFDSGKQNGFKALIYMHRYDADTVGRVRTDYLHKAQKYVETAMQSAQYTIDNATSASEKSKATKAVTKYTKQLAEMRIYDEAIAHVANQRIEIDLDDGVKVNYAKFQGVEVAQEGKKALKVDLLAKI